MVEGNILDVISGFKDTINSLPKLNFGFEEALDKLFEAFNLTMNELLPMKFFAVSDDKSGRRYLNIFDRAEDCENWIVKINELCTKDGIQCKKISYSKFLELAEDDWEYLNRYSCKPDRVVISV